MVMSIFSASLFRDLLVLAVLRLVVNLLLAPSVLPILGFLDNVLAIFHFALVSHVRVLAY